MRITLKVVVVTLAALGMSLQAEALTINAATTPNCLVTPACLLDSGPETSQADINVAIAPFIGASVDLYTQNVGGAETGPFAPNYQTLFGPDPLDPSAALITYVSGSFIASNPVYLLVKDGNQNPGYYLYRLVWNGTEDIVLTNFWPQQGAISHVTLYGTQATTVPDGGSMSMLLGMGLMGVAAIRRAIGGN